MLQRYRNNRHKDCLKCKDVWRLYDYIKVDGKFQCLICYDEFKTVQQVMQHYFKTHNFGDLFYIGYNPELLLRWSK